MSKYRPKDTPVVPVVGGGAAEGDTAREEEMRKWEEEQARRRAQQQQPAPTPPSESEGMVPPQGTPAPASASTELAPAETTGDEQVQLASEGAASGYLAMPVFTEPDSDDPAERLEAYTQGIFAVQYAARANQERIKQQKLIGLGLRLRAVKAEELHKTDGYDTFGDLTEARFGIKKHQANNILRVLDVAMSLEDITTQELQERPLRVLTPIQTKHGQEAVRETWLEASRHGHVTETSLREAANFLGYSPPKDADVQLEPPPPAPVPAPAPAQLVDSTRVVEQIRLLAVKNPERARLEVQRWKKAIEELMAEIPDSGD